MPLFDPDVYGDPVRVDKGNAYISIAWGATVHSAVDGSTGDLKFGFNEESTVTLAYYQLFETGAEPPSLLDAIKDTIDNFSIPADLDDIEAMQAGSIATLEGTGKLEFSGSVNLLALANAPASMTVASLNALPVKVTAGATVKIAADYKLSTDYQIRVQRLGEKIFRLGFYRKREAELDVSASAQGCFSATLGSEDLFKVILKAISTDPEIDKKTLASAGLSSNEVKDLQSAVKNAVDRTLSIGITAEAGIGAESDAMFLFEIDLNTLAVSDRWMVHRALDGNLTPLLSTEIPPAGIKLEKTLISSSKTLRHSLKVNLLGIYNYGSISKLVLEKSIGWDAVTGALVLTDKATASKIQIGASNFAADSKKLRHILAQQFFISAAYQAVAGMQIPDLLVQHTLFDLNSNMSRLQMRDGLLLASALGLCSEDDAINKLTPGLKSFGRATLYAEANYGDTLLEAIFLDANGRAREPSDYERAGRDALRYVVESGDDDEFRLLAVQNEAMWHEMCTLGDSSLSIDGSNEWAALIRKYTPAPAAPNLISHDFQNIRRWASAMNSAGQKIAAMRAFLQSHPGIDPGNHDFLNLRRDLATHLQNVAKNLPNDFGEPWGFTAMALIAGPAGPDSPKLLITNSHLTVVLEKGHDLPQRSLGSSTQLRASSYSSGQ